MTNPQDPVRFNGGPDHDLSGTDDSDVTAMLDGHRWPAMPASVHARLHTSLAGGGRRHRVPASHLVRFAATLLLGVVIGWALSRPGPVRVLDGDVGQDAPPAAASDFDAPSTGRVVVVRTVFARRPTSSVGGIDPSRWTPLAAN
ncbi:MAG: hypothetical protein KDA21_03125 [Phycisphaerales bacterium]|nr:hypothetical protein [Phycisphaerales bacterium]